MFRKCTLALCFMLPVAGFFLLPGTSSAAVRNSVVIQLQIKILLLKIEQLRLQLAELRARGGSTFLMPKVEPPKLLDQTVLNASVRQSVVNILCENTGRSPFKSISGSGVMIDPRGIIITNAHIGQFFLVSDYPELNSMRCVIRTGSPALPSYEARLMYLPPAWVEKNRSAIRSANATGTGEDDYAILAITASATSDSLPASFPFVPVDETVTSLADNYPVLLASYPGELVGSIIIKNSLALTSTVTTVTKGFYFETDADRQLDLLDVSGTIISQAGSSGGAAVSLVSGKLVGLIVTATEGATTGVRELRAVTLSHINRSMQKYTGQSLAQFLSQNPLTAVSNFEVTIAPQERALLIQ